MKRLFDIVVSLGVIFFVLAWLVPLVGLLIMIDSPGPIMYKQWRIGYKGVAFQSYKFRTTRILSGLFEQRTAYESDKVTRLGNFLRKTHLDEMPQFINVLLGDMSIVGPKLVSMSVASKNRHSVANYLERYRVRPGITGLAQVRHLMSKNKYDNNLTNQSRYDRIYINKYSFWLDLLIIRDTLANLLSGVSHDESYLSSITTKDIRRANEAMLHLETARMLAEDAEINLKIGTQTKTLSTRIEPEQINEAWGKVIENEKVQLHL